MIYANKAIVEQERAAEENLVHYASVNFAKLQAKPEGKLEQGEIRGLASKTSEYAQIRLHSRGDNGGRANEEETVKWVSHLNDSWNAGLYDDSVLRSQRSPAEQNNLVKSAAAAMQAVLTLFSVSPSWISLLKNV